MHAFDRLSPALRVQIVNGLGWSALRPVQEQAIDAILDGKNAVILAPTAGGKTEASLFPLLSLMETEDRPPTSVLYIAPIRALLNNQEARLRTLTGLIGRRAFKWHGDVSSSARKRFIREPADILAITPESLEAMLMSSRVPGQRLLSQIRAVIVDEVHAFAADDRGSHLVALLERIQRLCGEDIQRIGLSATVGDPEAILKWLKGSSRRGGEVVNPGGGGGAEPEVHLDYVGSLSNAAHLIHRLYPGARRLVFVDSRKKVEELGALLSQRGVDTFVTHSSLAASERHAAERAFEERSNCVIVATSALELGIDVGDLDRVIQIDAPSTVSSFLQRMGRTGRRPGTRANCTFMATSDDALLQGAGLLHLWSQGFVEDTAPDFRATHVLAHQLIALGIQQLGVGTADWWGAVEGCSAFHDIKEAERAELLAHMMAEDIITEVDSRLILGRRGETLYAGANFRELYAVFQAPPVLKVLHGRREIGTVDAWFAQQNSLEKVLCFVLGGRAWEVTHLDWRRGLCRVRPADAGTYPRWMGQPLLLSRALCQAMKAVLVGAERGATWTQRAATVMEGLRVEYAFLEEGVNPLVSDAQRVRWWSFAGGRANNLLASLLKVELGDKVTSNNLCITFAGGAAQSDVAIREAIRDLLPQLRWERARQLAPDSARGRISKFQPCLPEALELDLLARHLLDVEGAREVAQGQRAWVEVEPDAETQRAQSGAASKGPDEQDESGDRASADGTSPSPRAREPGAEPLGSGVPPGPASKLLQRMEPRRPVHFIDDFQQLDALVPKLLKEGAVAFDVETWGPARELCLAQLGTAAGSWIIDALAIEDLSPLATVLDSPRVVKIIQYASFERDVMARKGMDIQNIFDTWAASRRKHGIRAPGGHSLAMLCERELGVRLDKGEQTSDWRRRPLSKGQLDYAALDVEVLVELYAVLGP